MTLIYKCPEYRRFKEWDSKFADIIKVAINSRFFTKLA